MYFALTDTNFVLTVIFFFHLYTCCPLQVTSNAIKNEIEGVALQAIEFWSTICDAELTIVSEAEEAGTRQQQPTRVSGAFAKRALQGLLPLMLECLTQQV